MSQAEAAVISLLDYTDVVFRQALAGRAERRINRIESACSNSCGARVKAGRGAVVAVKLDQTAGHEQRGVGPCPIVSDADVTGDQRIPAVTIAPVAGTAVEGSRYPPLSPGKSGLATTSYAVWLAGQST